MFLACFYSKFLCLCAKSARYLTLYPPLVLQLDAINWLWLWLMTTAVNFISSLLIFDRIWHAESWSEQFHKFMAPNIASVGNIYIGHKHHEFLIQLNHFFLPRKINTSMRARARALYAIQMVKIAVIDIHNMIFVLCCIVCKLYGVRKLRLNRIEATHKYDYGITIHDYTIFPIETLKYVLQRKKHR